MILMEFAVFWQLNMSAVTQIVEIMSYLIYFEIVEDGDQTF